MDGTNLTTEMYDVINIERVMSKNISIVQKDDTIYDVATSIP